MLPTTEEFPEEREIGKTKPLIGDIIFPDFINYNASKWFGRSCLSELHDRVGDFRKFLLYAGNALFRCMPYFFIFRHKVMRLMSRERAVSATRP